MGSIGIFLGADARSIRPLVLSLDWEARGRVSWAGELRSFKARNAGAGAARKQRAAAMGTGVVKINNFKEIS
jgi:hypothetical protein